MAPDGTNPSCIAHLRSVMRSAKHDATAGRPESITFLAVRARATESRRRRRARPGASNPAANGRDAAIGEAALHPHPRSEAHAKGREAGHGAPPNRQATWVADSTVRHDAAALPGAAVEGAAPFVRRPPWGRAAHGLAAPLRSPAPPGASGDASAARCLASPAQCQRRHRASRGPPVSVWPCQGCPGLLRLQGMSRGAVDVEGGRRSSQGGSPSRGFQGVAVECVAVHGVSRDGLSSRGVPGVAVDGQGGERGVPGRCAFKGFPGVGR